MYSFSNSVVINTYDAYDPMGRAETVSKTFVDDGNSITYSSAFEYDLAGNLTLMTYPDAHEVTYEYYPGTRLLHRVLGPDEEPYGTFEDYIADAKIGHLYMGNGTATDYHYDLWSNRLTMIHTKDTSTEPAGDITRKRYKYTPAGDIEEIVNELRGVSRLYRYDKLHRLKSEKSSNAALVHPSRVIELTYRYDDNQPFHAPKSIEKSNAIQEPVYDNNGNMTLSHDFSVQDEVPIRNIKYNADNMPTQIDRNGSNESVTVTFTYDGESKRAKKVKPSGSTYYIGDHFEIIKGQPTKYIFAGNLRIAKVTPTAMQYYHKDHLQSSTALSDIDGNKIASTDYLPYGLDRAPPGMTQTNYRFTDQEFDPETGLYNFDARLYDPVIGRFISADTLVQNYYNPQMLNRYSYVTNNPLSYVDLDGHARYRAVLRTYSGGNVVGGAYIMGTVYALDKNQRGLHDAASFSGKLYGFTAGVFFGKTFQVMDFEDKYETPDVKRIEGDAIYMSATLALDEGGSVSKYKFNELESSGKKESTLTEESENYHSRVKGYDASADLFWGWTSLEGDVYEVEGVMDVNEYYNENELKGNNNSANDNPTKNYGYLKDDED